MKKEKGYTIKSTDIELVPVKPENEDYTIWDIKWDIKERKDEKRLVGDLAFTGAPERGTVNIEFHINPEFKNHGYAKEALKTIVEWAFARKGIYEITASCDPDNEAAVHVLERAGFVFRSGNRSVEHYSVIKEKSSWLGLYILIGFVLGLALVVIFDNVVIGMILGLVAGTSVGAYLDTSSNKEREKVTGEKVKFRKFVKTNKNKISDINENAEGSYFIREEADNSAEAGTSAEANASAEAGTRAVADSADSDDVNGAVKADLT